MVMLVPPFTIWPKCIMFLFFSTLLLHFGIINFITCFCFWSNYCLLLRLKTSLPQRKKEFVIRKNKLLFTILWVRCQILFIMCCWRYMVDLQNSIFYLYITVGEILFHFSVTKNLVALEEIGRLKSGIEICFTCLVVFFWWKD